MEIRQAIAGDAEEACTAAPRSITECCAVDHGNDPAILARWLDNKTPESCLSLNLGLGGERAYRGRLGNDWSPRHSRHFIVSSR
jgi:hypothetical protein